MKTASIAVPLSLVFACGSVVTARDTAAAEYRSRYAAACARIPDLIDSAARTSNRARPDPDPDPETETETETEDTASGGLGRSDIRRTIAARIGEVRSCYVNALAAWPDAQGEVVFKFVIDPAGSVQKVGILKNTTAIRPLACCIGEVLESWRFPASEGMAIVTYPFVLKLTH